jgi:hypothetical protein
METLSEAEMIMYAVWQEYTHIQRLVNTIYDLFMEIHPNELNARKRRYWCVFYCSDVATQTDLELIQQFTRYSSALLEQDTQKIQK